MPPLWHGLFCTAKLPPSRLGADGLAKDEGLLPAASDFPNKLFGGARFDFRSSLHIGEKIRAESEVISFNLKEGRSGIFIVGLVQHRIYNDAGLAVIEKMTLFSARHQKKRPTNFHEKRRLAPSCHIHPSGRARPSAHVPAFGRNL